MSCVTCGGSRFSSVPCRVPDWARDTSFYQNNQDKFDMAMARAHRWFSRAWLAEVAAVRAAIRALPAVVTFACSGCGKYAFPEPGVLCFWCVRADAPRGQP